MGFRLRGFLASLVIFGALATGLLGFSGDVLNTYGNQETDLSVLEEEANRTFESVNSTVNEQQAEAEGIKGDVTEGLFVLNSVASVLSQTIQSITSVFTLVGSLGKYLGIPTWFIGMVTTIISIYVIYELVSLYRGIRT